MARNKCKHCDLLVVEASGPEDSPILVVGEFPGYYEVTSGTPFQGPAGDVLRSELTRLSIDYGMLRVTNLWGHEPNKDPDDLSWHLGRLIKEMDGRKAVLLLGSETVTAILHKAVMDVSGLEQKSDLVPDSVELLMAAVNPAFVIHGTVGEFRTDLGKFIRKARRYLK